MSHFFPTTEYAEDQPLPRSILTTHVLYRGFQTGTTLALLGRTAQNLRTHQPITTSILVRAAATGAPIGTGLMGLALLGRMWGREEIEWKDRSWGLMHNQGQVEIDDWSQVGGVVGSVAGVLGCLVWRQLTGLRGVLVSGTA
ncbi:hypothetical protein BDW59DRAFT_152339 [Aspergillus cavernicola]|uniref:Uncharacterized protein n=1 Tax=Aspergillus cavernicola TaxID=176166 RepID=A0ABR4HR92_9EURO